MFSRVQDGIGRTLLILFLVKPTIDLTYFLSFNIAGMRLSPLHLVAAFLFVYLLRFRFQLGSRTPPFTRFIETFIGLHFIAIVIGTGTNARLSLVLVVDQMLRMLDSYLIYMTAYLAATRYRYKDAQPFVKAIVIGCSLPVLANVVAVQLGINSSAWSVNAGSASAAAFRMAGLYYDPGVLANVAFFNLVFSIFLFHLTPIRLRFPVGSVLMLLVLADLYLIASSKSRAVMVELAMFGMVYLWVFQKAWGKILAPIVASAIIGAAVFFFDISLEELFVRFEGDVAALEGGSETGVGIGEGGEVSLGSLEGLGNNRVASWADALTRLLQRSAPEILFGNFSVSVAHSDYIDIFARSGIISLLIYLTFVIGLTLRSWRLSQATDQSSDRTLYFMAFTLLLCYLFYSMPFRPLGYTTTNWYMWSIIGLAMARSRIAAQEATAEARKRLEKKLKPPPSVEPPPEEAADSRPPRRRPPVKVRRPRTY